MLSRWFKREEPVKIEVKFDQEYIYAGQELSGKIYITAIDNDIFTESITVYHITNYFNTSYSLNTHILYSFELPNCKVLKKHTEGIPFIYRYPKNGPWTVGFRPFFSFEVKLKELKTVRVEADLVVHPHPSVAKILKIIDSSKDFKVYKTSIETMFFIHTRFKDMPERYLVGNKRLYQQAFNLTEYKYLDYSFMFRWVRFVFSVTEEGVEVLLMPQGQPTKERYNIHFFVNHEDTKEEIMNEIHKYLSEYSNNQI